MSCCSDCKALASILDIGTTCRECGRGMIVADLPTVVTAYDLGRKASQDLYGSDCNPWLDDADAEAQRKAWDRGHADFLNDGRES